MKRTMILLFSAVAVFWNVENYFDPRSASAPQYWTKSRMMTKARAISKLVLSLADSTGTPPDYVALAEVDNDYVLRQLVYQTALSAYGYRYVHFDSRDHRGIDCALLYRGDRPRSRAVPLVLDADTLATRDILVCEFDSLTLMICHLPSKRGGSPEAVRRRECGMRTIDSLARLVSGPLVVMGDFNDTRSALSDSLMASLVELQPRGFAGTIKFEGQWEQIDRCLVRGVQGELEVCNLELLTTEDKSYGGVKPLRTFSGPRYLGGVSDHYPILIHCKAGLDTYSIITIPAN